MRTITHPLFSLLFTTYSVLFTFPGHGSFHTLAVTSQLVQWGMMCCWEWVYFFQVKLLKQQDFQVTQKYPSFHYFSIMFENRICTAFFFFFKEGWEF